MAFPETAPAISGCVSAYPHSWTSWSNASNSVLMPDSSPAAASISVSTALKRTPPPASTATDDPCAPPAAGGEVVWCGTLTIPKLSAMADDPHSSNDSLSNIALGVDEGTQDKAVSRTDPAKRLVAAVGYADNPPDDNREWAR